VERHAALADHESDGFVLARQSLCSREPDPHLPTPATAQAVLADTQARVVPTVLCRDARPFRHAMAHAIRALLRLVCGSTPVAQRGRGLRSCSHAAKISGKFLCALRKFFRDATAAPSV
jgi:hypothetical protein